MAYCTIDDVKLTINNESFLEIGKDIDDPNVIQMIQDVEDKMNIRLCFGFTMPLASPIPNVIKNICAEWVAGEIINKLFGSQQGETARIANKFIDNAKRDLRRLIIAHKNELITYTGQTIQARTLSIGQMADNHLEAILEEEEKVEF